MTEAELISLISDQQEWVKWALGSVIGVQTLVFVTILALPGRLRREFVPREVVESRLAENDRFHSSLARDLGFLREKIAEATTAINGHAKTETEILVDILKELKRGNGNGK